VGNVDKNGEFPAFKWVKKANSRFNYPLTKNVQRYDQMHENPVTFIALLALGVGVLAC